MGATMCVARAKKARQEAEANDQSQGKIHPVPAGPDNVRVFHFCISTLPTSFWTC